MKNYKYVWSKRSKFRRFVDFLNDSGIFKEKIEYPVVHQKRVLEYEDKRNLWYITKENFDELYGRLSKEQREETIEFYKRNFEEDKKNFPKVNPAYVDFKERVVLKDKIENICKGYDLDLKKKEFMTYLQDKFRIPSCDVEFVVRENNTDILFYDDGLERECLSLTLNVSDKKQTCEYRWSYFVDVVFVRTHHEEKIGTSELALYLDSCVLTIYVD